MRFVPFRSLFLALAGAGLALAGAGARAAGHEPEAATLDFALKATDGYNYRLSEYRGEVVAVLFWASWCGGCRGELERLQRLRGIYANAGLQVLAVSVDDDVEAAEDVARAVGATFPVLHDSGKEVSRSRDLEVLPTMLLVDRAGRVRFVHLEPDAGGGRQLLGELRMLLDE